MPFLEVIREVQIPLVAVILLVACATKVRQLRRTGSLEPGLGPTALFPLSMRRPVAIAMCVAEAVLGIGLILTACSTRATGGVATATIARLGAGLLFLVATSTLIELRTVRPDAGCGCFGDFSTAPVSGRTIARSALLAVAILSTIGLSAKAPHGGIVGLVGLELLAVVCAELLLIGSLSPEVGASLIRLGYSEPCELRHVPAARTLSALRHSKQWRRNAGLTTSDVPADVWRELCWRYVVYPSSYDGRAADLVFAVFLQYRRPVVRTALVDSLTGMPLPLPAGKSRKRRVSPPPAEAAAAVPAGGGEATDAAGTASAASAAGAVAATSAVDAAGAPGAVGGVDAASGVDSYGPVGPDGPVDAASVGAAAATDDPDATLVDVLPRQP